MAERPTEPSAGQPFNRGREDTVVRPFPTGEPLNGEARTDGKVMPPMPTNGQPATKEQRRPSAPPDTPPSNRAVERPTAETTVPTQRKPASPPSPSSPKPSGPPPQARNASPATQPTPVVPVAPASAPEKQAPVDRQARQAKRVRTKAQKAPKPAKPARKDRSAEKKTAAAPRPGRRARLRMTRIDPWSVMKTSFLLSIALGVVTVVSVLMVWSVLGAADVWGSINQTVQDVVGGQEASTFDIEDYIGTRRVVGFTIIVAAIDVVLLTAIATLAAFLYNMSASLLGGIEVTLAEDN
jgi:hypothetical protein